MANHIRVPVPRRMLTVIAAVALCCVLPRTISAEAPPTAGDDATAGEDANKGRNDYLTKVKPLLKERCYACHAGLKQQAGLRLDTMELMLRRRRLWSGSCEK